MRGHLAAVALGAAVVLAGAWATLSSRAHSTVVESPANGLEVTATATTSLAVTAGEEQHHAASPNGTETSPVTDAGLGPSPVRQLVVRLIDVESGAVVDGGSVAVHAYDGRSWNVASPEPGDDGVRACPVPVGATPGRTKFVLAVTAPDGWAAASLENVDEPRAPAADVLSLDVPVWRDRPFEIEIPDRKRGDSVRRARVRVGPTTFDVRIEPTSAPEVFRVRGSAFVAGDLTTIDVWTESSGSRQWTAFVPSPDPSGAVPRVALRPYEEPTRFTPLCGVVGGGEWHDDGNSCDPNADTQVTVRVRTTEGLPAAAIRLAFAADDGDGWRHVVSAETDALGTAVVDDLPAGRISIHACAAGFAVTEQTFVLGDRGVVQVTIDEDRSPPAHVLVVDEGGNPVAGARVRVRRMVDGCSWAAIENGVQRLVILTGPDGRATLPRIGSLRSGARISASLGSRTGTELYLGANPTRISVSTESRGAFR